MTNEQKELAEYEWTYGHNQIGSDISDLDYYAGRNVMEEHEFMKAIEKYQAEQDKKIQELIEKYEHEVSLYVKYPVEDDPTFVEHYNKVIEDLKQLIECSSN
jgi:hypothetical protein